MHDGIAFLEDEFVPLCEARIPILDRGLLFGDACYEVLPVFSGTLFREQQHLDRLYRSLASFKFTRTPARTQLERMFAEGIQRMGGGDIKIYLEVTRGIAHRDLTPPDTIEPYVFAMFTRFTQVPDRTICVHAIYDPRWKRCDIKTPMLGGNVLGRLIAAEHGCEDVIFLDDADMIREGSACNVFVWHGDAWYTHPHSTNILPGVTRDCIVEAAARADIRVCEETVSWDTLCHAEEAFVSSSTAELVPIRSTSNGPLAVKAPGPRYAAIREAYRSLRDQELATA